MRRPTIPWALLLTLVACGGEPAVARPNAIDQLPVEIGLDVAAAKGAVESFLHGYAGAASDGGDELASVIGNPRILRWAKWVVFQNRLFPGRVEGELDVRNLQFVDFLQLRDENLAAQVDVDASITFTTTTLGGRSETFTRDFAGPFLVFRREPGHWAVLDATREGASMDHSIHAIAGDTVEADGLSVRLDSVFTFPPNWQVNVVVANRTGDELSLRPRDAILTLPGGAQVRGKALAVGGSLSVIPDGTKLPGGVIFDEQDSTRGVVLSLRLTGGKEPVVVEFPLEDAFSLDQGPVVAPTGAAVVSAP